VTAVRPRPRPDEDGLPAGFVTRLVAVAIDLGLLSAIITTVTVFGQFIGQSLNAGVWTLRFIAVSTTAFSLSLYMIYFVASTVLGGQTLGKRIMGVRIVRMNGDPVRMKVSVKRYLCSFLSLPLFWGYLLVLIDNRRQTFHDKVADTVVIYYTIPADQLGPFEQYLRAMRLRREAKLVAEKAALAEKLASVKESAPEKTLAMSIVDGAQSEVAAAGAAPVPPVQAPTD
jgi:uncharacterized RDD family membrane protein YckC